MSSSALVERYVQVYKDQGDDSAILNYGRSGATLTADSNEDYTAFVVTTLDEDRDGDTVVPMGWYGKNYERNPVWFFGHQDWEIAIGTSRSPDGRICCFPENDQMVQWLWWDKADSDAMFLKGKYDRGIMSATSIAFVPIKAYRKDDVRKAQQHEGGPGGWVFEEWDHTETSCVGVPANQNATRIQRGANGRGMTVKSYKQYLDECGCIVRDMCDQERGHISKKLEQCLRTCYAAKSTNESGGCWTGWCPPKKALITFDDIEPKTKSMDWTEWLALATGILGNVAILAPAVMQTLRQQWQRGKTPEQAAAAVKPEQKSHGSCGCKSTCACKSKRVAKVESAQLPVCTRCRGKNKINIPGLGVTWCPRCQGTGRDIMQLPQTDRDAYVTQYHGKPFRDVTGSLKSKRVAKEKTGNQTLAHRNIECAICDQMIPKGKQCWDDDEFGIICWPCHQEQSAGRVAKSPLSGYDPLSVGINAIGQIASGVAALFGRGGKKVTVGARVVVDHHNRLGNNVEGKVTAVNADNGTIRVDFGEGPEIVLASDVRVKSLVQADMEHAAPMIDVKEIGEPCIAARIGGAWWVVDGDYNKLDGPFDDKAEAEEAAKVVSKALRREGTKMQKSFLMGERVRVSGEGFGKITNIRGSKFGQVLTVSLEMGGEVTVPEARVSYKSVKQKAQGEVRVRPEKVTEFLREAVKLGFKPALVGEANGREVYQIGGKEDDVQWLMSQYDKALGENSGAAGGYTVPESKSGIDEHYDEGYTAAWNGKPRSQNPYHRSAQDRDEDDRFMDWDEGWTDGAKERLQGNKSLRVRKVLDWPSWSEAALTILGFAAGGALYGAGSAIAGGIADKLKQMWQAGKTPEEAARVVKPKSLKRKGFVIESGDGWIGRNGGKVTQLAQAQKFGSRGEAETEMNRRKQRFPNVHYDVADEHEYEKSLRVRKGQTKVVDIVTLRKIVGNQMAEQLRTERPENKPCETQFGEDVVVTAMSGGTYRVEYKSMRTKAFKVIQDMSNGGPMLDDNDKPVFFVVDSGGSPVDENGRPGGSGILNRDYFNTAQAAQRLADKLNKKKSMRTKSRRTGKTLRHSFAKDLEEAKDAGGGVLPHEVALAKLCKMTMDQQAYITEALGGVTPFDAQTGDENKAHGALKGIGDALGQHLEACKQAWADNVPDKDLDEALKGFETSGDGKSNTGEANLVDEGQTVPVEGDLDDQLEADIDEVSDVEMDIENNAVEQDLDDVEMDIEDSAVEQDLGDAIPTDIEETTGGDVGDQGMGEVTASEVGSPEWAEEEANEPEHQMDEEDDVTKVDDPSTTEILERYQDTSKKWRAKRCTLGRVQRVLRRGGKIKSDQYGRKWLVIGSNRVAKRQQMRVQKAKYPSGSEQEAAYLQGQEAAKTGKPKSSNPHMDPYGREHGIAAAWIQGYLEPNRKRFISKGVNIESPDGKMMTLETAPPRVREAIAPDTQSGKSRGEVMIAGRLWRWEKRLVRKQEGIDDVEREVPVELDDDLDIGKDYSEHSDTMKNCGAVMRGLSAAHDMPEHHRSALDMHGEKLMKAADGKGDVEEVGKAALKHMSSLKEAPDVPDHHKEALEHHAGEMGKAFGEPEEKSEIDDEATVDKKRKKKSIRKEACSCGFNYGTNDMSSQCPECGAARKAIKALDADEECPACSGTGRSPAAQPSGQPKPCANCKGTGWVSGGRHKDEDEDLEKAIDDDKADQESKDLLEKLKNASMQMTATLSRTGMMN